MSARSREYAHTQQLPTTIEVVDKEVSGAVALLTWHAGDIAASDKETEVMNALTLCANEPDDPNSDSVQIDEMTSGVKFLQLNVGDSIVPVVFSLHAFRRVMGQGMTMTEPCSCTCPAKGPHPLQYIYRHSALDPLNSVTRC